jgi:hypothetical protein
VNPLGLVAVASLHASNEKNVPDNKDTDQHNAPEEAFLALFLGRLGWGMGAGILS